MQIELSGKVAIVTGAGRGIGRIIARTLAREGVTVATLELRTELLEDLASEWNAEGWPGLHLQCDLTKSESIKSAIAAIDAEYGRIDILVNNAGIANGGRIEDLPEAIWDANFAINTKAAYLVAQAVAPIMKRGKWGRILNAASYAAITPSIGSAAYAASKAAIVSFTRVLAGELGPHNITVNCYAPGMIPTDMNGFANASPERQEKLLDTLSIRKWGDPQDVANLICFLASDLASYITGTMIDISGGKYATQMPWLAYRDA
jgi:3-oxoacyl-[acyl-carrier protein] reductase